MDTAETLWADFKRPIANADDYLASLRGRRMNVFFMEERSLGKSAIKKFRSIACALC